MKLEWGRDQSMKYLIFLTLTFDSKVIGDIGDLCFVIYTSRNHCAKFIKTLHQGLLEELADIFLSIFDLDL